MPEWSASQQPDSGKAVLVLCAILPLTRRQAEVLHWMAEAKTNEEIATILQCSFFTVKAHTREIFRRLNVHSRLAAAACAYRAHTHYLNGQISSPERAVPENPFPG